MTTARHERSPATASSSRCSAPHSSAVIALRLSGRLSVRTRTCGRGVSLSRTSVTVAPLPSRRTSVAHGAPGVDTGGVRQLEITRARSVEGRDAPRPALGGDGEALVRPLAVAMCDLDAAFLSGRVPIAEPFPLGHECVGEVVEVGDAVRAVAPGDVVVVPFQISCGACAACAAGHTGSCTAVPRGSAYGMKPLGGDWGGALADVVRVPFADAMLVVLPEGIDPVAVASVA